jgi:acyl dehydratase
VHRGDPPRHLTVAVSPDMLRHDPRPGVTYTADPGPCLSKGIPAMALDHSFIGKTYAPTRPYEVSREKIREFADAIGERSELCRNADAARAAGYPDVIAPPTFLTVINLDALGVIINDSELGLDYQRMVHGGQSFTHHRPVCAGDRLVAFTQIENIVARVGNEFLTVCAEIRTEDGELVTTARASLVVRGEAA